MGSQQKEQFYNEAFTNDRNYNVHYTSCNYLSMWRDILKFINKNDSIIELACGPGQFADLLYEYGVRKYKGYDFSSRAIEMAYENCPEFNFAKKDLFEFIPDYSDTDLIIILEFLEHVDDDISILKLIPSGKNILFTVPSFDGTAHVRYFNNIDEINQRFIKVIDIKELYQFGNHFVCYGVKK